MLQIRFVARRVRAAEHRVRVARDDGSERLVGEERADRANEMGRVLAPGEKAKSAWRRCVGVNHSGDATLRKLARDLTPDIVGPVSRAGDVEDQQLHEEPSVHRLPFPFPLAAVLVDIDCGKAGLLGIRIAHFVTQRTSWDANCTGSGSGKHNVREMRPMLNRRAGVGMASWARLGELEVTQYRPPCARPFRDEALSRMVARSKPAVIVRAAALVDVPQLVAMNHAAYPELVEENVVWNEGQLRSHIARFPQGQLVADGNGVPMGAISTFIVSRTRNPLEAHTWLGITEDGTFAGHDPGGDTLYLADIYVDPAAWGKGVSQMLYAALRDLCVGLGLRRIVAGGRLWGYHEHAAKLTPQEYIARVLRGELRDRVLGSQIKAGFVVRGVLVGYLRDPRSNDFATLLEWVRPTERPS